MAVEMISWPISMKERCRTGGSNSRLPEYQSDAHPTELPGPAIPAYPNINFQHVYKVANLIPFYSGALAHVSMSTIISEHPISNSINLIVKSCLNNCVPFPFVSTYKFERNLKI